MAGSPRQRAPREPSESRDRARHTVRAHRRGGAIALTGINTYLGRSLIAAFERERRWKRIVAIDVKNTPTSGPKTRFYKVDLTQPAVDARLAEILHSENVDTVVHGAFLGSPTRATAWAHELESVGTMHVLGACEEHSVRKLVLWSHTILYGARPDNPLYMTEDHPLRVDQTWSFVADKLDAERQVVGFADRARGTVVTVLRTALTVGPTARNLVTELLRRPAMPTVLGYDPRVQLIHEVDVVAAFRIAIDQDHSGVFNIVAPGVLPLTSIARLAGVFEVPFPSPIARAAFGALFALQVSRPSPALLDYLRFPCVASGEKAARQLGFRASYSTHEALVDFVRTFRGASSAADRGVVSGTTPERGAL